ncbi:MAG: hypothetical protein ACX939_05440 [Hyphococcus sp.]
MRVMIGAIAAALWAQPAAALDDFSHTKTRPRAIAAFEFQERAIEIAAVTRRKRADTAIRRAYLEETLAMRRVYPGYPQPAFVTLDIRVPF